MTKVAILPIFTIRGGHVDAFLTRIRQQRDDALTKEPGCLQFDILLGDAPNEITLYEVYADADALETHRTYPHYADFKATTEPMVESLVVHRYRLD